MPQDRVPLFVRLPRDQVAALDRLVDATGQRKQRLVSDLLADRLQTGRIEISETPDTSAEVLTLDEVARLLRLPTDAVRALAEDRELPCRCVGGEWRFARSAVLLWLSGVPAKPGDTEAGEASGHG
jgi:excisionase family DNA binding protein